MSYKEKDFQSDFTRWLREKAHLYGMNKTFVYELKITHEKRISFSRVEEHQITSLKKAKNSCIRHKISDQAMGFHPFDGGQWCMVPAYIIILWYIPRKPKVPIWIDIDDFIHLQETHDKKSITYQDAIKVGKTYGAI